jgi:Xaa-Pro aminopeptidase
VALLGVLPSQLVSLAQEIAGQEGYDLWENFLGHGIGLDCQERPVLTTDSLPLAENMVIALEPRLVFGESLLANEDMVRITADGGVTLSHFPQRPLPFY